MGTKHTPQKLKIGDFFGDKKQLTYADMFCGIGGFHAAADSLGMKCVFACDIDEDARKAYEANYGIRPESDICRVEPSSVPDHDVLFAGFPCQPFSIIGAQAGFADARGTLFFELAKIIEAKQPQAFVLENVKQLRTHNNGQTLARILEILRGMKYTVDYKVFNALNFGLPQKRERILIVGFKGGVEGFDWPDKKMAMRPLSEVLEKKPDKALFASERIRRARHEAHKAKVKPSIWHENKAGNICSYPYSCALRAGASYNYLLVDGERRLSSREMLRLQGFPESFQIVCTDGQTRKQAGNAVPVPVVRAVLEKVLHAKRAETAGSRDIAARSITTSPRRDQAVMGRFHERDPNDYYKTPPAVTRALLARETFQAQVHEPACGDGAISEVLIGAGYDVVSSDLVDRGYGYCPADFLLFPVQADGEADLITNPPFGIADEFVEHAHNLGYRKMAFLLRLAWLEGEARRARLFVNHPPVRVHVFSPRQTLWKGSDPNPRSSGGMAAYAWFVFENGFRGDPTLHWISRAECAVNMKEAS